MDLKEKRRSATLSDRPGLSFDFAYLYHFLLRKSRIIMSYIVLSVSAAIAYLIIVPKIYASRAAIQVEQEEDHPCSEY
jgi:uncharacterized protein involved in exopolysaccharide biosynthesis